VIIPAAIRSEQRMRCSARHIANLEGMNVLINARSGARLAAACSVLVALAPVTAAALSTPSAGGAPGRHAPSYDLCDGHKWSLFGCRPDHHQIQQQDVDGAPLAD
jgi:hypothetical protein